MFRQMLRERDAHQAIPIMMAATIALAPIRVTDMLAPWSSARIIRYFVTVSMIIVWSMTRWELGACVINAIDWLEVKTPFLVICSNFIETRSTLYFCFYYNLARGTTVGCPVGHCYYDGCNWCSCNKGQEYVCTTRACYNNPVVCFVR